MTLQADLAAMHDGLRKSLAEKDAEIGRLKAALEDARRDLNGLSPRSDRGSKRKKIIEAAVARIETALRIDREQCVEGRK